MKKSYIAIIVVIILAVLSNRFTDTDTAVTTEAWLSESSSSEASSSAMSTHKSDDPSDYNWGNPKTLQDHFERHGPDFNAKDAQDYARQAHEFYENRSQYQIKNENGILRVYDAATNTFGAYNKNGTTRSFYKPSAGQAYFDRQPGDIVS